VKRGSSPLATVRRRCVGSRGGGLGSSVEGAQASSSSTRSITMGPCSASTSDSGSTESVVARPLPLAREVLAVAGPDFARGLGVFFAVVFLAAFGSTTWQTSTAHRAVSRASNHSYGIYSTPYSKAAVGNHTFWFSCKESPGPFTSTNLHFFSVEFQTMRSGTPLLRPA
jgi:hypothetical protein